MKTLALIFAVAIVVTMAQTRVSTSQLNPMIAPLVNGQGTTLQQNGDGSGQVNVSRLVRSLAGTDTVTSADCHGMIVSPGYALALPVPATVPGFPNGCEVIIRNTGAPITLTGGLISTVGTNASCMIDSDGSVWQIEIC